MGLKNSKFAVIGFAAFSLTSSALAWHSVLGSTHEKISKKAYEFVDKGIYPDLSLASEEIQDGSSSESGHESNHTGGGKMRDWWYGGDERATLYGGVLPNYAKFAFKGAYFNLGRMVHLTQDQAVPAHAARIPHGWGGKHLDGMEKYAQYDADFDPVPSVDYSKQPYDYYQELQNNTRDLLPTWVNPKTSEPYWRLAAGAPLRGKDVTLGPTGSYGGGKDSYTYSVPAPAPDPVDAHTVSNDKPEMASLNPEIARERLAIAAGYTRAMIEAASKKLPPLVSGLAISANVLVPGQKMEISFTALENRTKHVSYAVVVERSGGRPETVLAGVIELNDPARGEYLFSRGVTLSWDGLIAGRAPEEGSYRLEVRLTDEDGNMVPARVNADSVRENDTKAVFSVVNTASGKSPSLSF
jgi:hypothetical protein